MKSGDVGEKVALGGDAVLRIGMVVLCGYHECGVGSQGFAHSVRRHHLRHAHGIAYFLFKHERSARKAYQCDYDTERYRQPHMYAI